LAGLRSPSSFVVLMAITRIAAPLLVGGLVRWHSSAVSRLIDLASPGGLVAVQFCRVLGVNFVALRRRQAARPFGIAGRNRRRHAPGKGIPDVALGSSGFCLRSPQRTRERVSAGLDPDFPVALSILPHVMSLIKLKRTAAHLKTSGLRTRGRPFLTLRVLQLVVLDANLFTRWTSTISLGGFKFDGSSRVSDEPSRPNERHQLELVTRDQRTPCQRRSVMAASAPRSPHRPGPPLSRCALRTQC
jgi:hypothetical protein